MKYDTAKLLLAKIARAERASDFSAWHAMSAADMGEILTEARGELRARGLVLGYDGIAYGAGDRVELHPGCDLWAQGARYGEVLAIVDTTEDAVRVKLDKLPRRKFSGPPIRFRKIA
jgi:hypothetical protein